jgi:hypothetical protein
MFGDVKLETFRSPEWTSAGVYTHLQGKPSDVVSGPNDIRVADDVLKLRIGFFARGNIIPDSAGIEITSFSPTRFKYKNDSRMIIFIDGAPIVSEGMEVQGFFGGIAERLSATIKYADFLKLTNANKVTLQLGQTEIRFKREVLHALNGMSDLTKELKPRPVWRYVGGQP